MKFRARQVTCEKSDWRFILPRGQKGLCSGRFVQLQTSRLFNAFTLGGKLKHSCTLTFIGGLFVVGFFAKAAASSVQEA